MERHGCYNLVQGCNHMYIVYKLVTRLWQVWQACYKFNIPSMAGVVQPYNKVVQPYNKAVQGYDKVVKACLQFQFQVVIT